MKKLFLFLLLPLMSVACGGGGSSDDGPPTDSCNLISSPAKIINGTTCQTRDSAIVRISVGTATCTGTLVTPSQVLTAGHCVHDLTSISSINAGPISASKMLIYRADSQVALAGVEKVTSHPDFAADWIAYIFGRRNSDKKYINEILAGGVADIAILDLDRSLRTIPQPIGLTKTPVVGQVFGIFGFGATNGGDPFATESLNSGTMTVAGVGKDNWTAVFQFGGGNTCFGDSGGPALNTIGVPSIIGMTTLGTATNCKLGEVSLFTLVSSSRMADFIQRVAPLAEFE